MSRSRNNKCLNFLIFISLAFFFEMPITFSQKILSKSELIKLITYGIDVYNEDGLLIKSEDLYDYLVLQDTICGFTYDENFCFNYKFVDNQFQKLITGSSIERRLEEIDLQYSKKIIESTEVIKREYDPETLELKYTAWLIRIKNDQLEKVRDSLVINNCPKDKRLITRENEYWRVQNVKLKNEEITLDECHKKYELVFHQNEFIQSYNNEWKCESMIVEPYGEEEDSMLPISKNILHELNFKRGKWETRNEMLFLLNEMENDLLLWKYTIQDENLVLVINKDITLTLTRKTASNNK